MEERGSSTSPNRRVKIFAILAFSAGFALTAFLLYRVSLHPILIALVNLGVGGLIVIALAHVPIICLLGTAWWSIVEPRERSGVRVWTYIWARAVRDAAAEALPFSQVGGYVIGARALNLRGANASSASVSTFVDLTIEFVAKIPYLLLGLLILEWLKSTKGGTAAIIGIVVCVAATALLLHPRASTVPHRIFERFIPRWDRIAASRQRLLDVLRHMTDRRAALLPSALLHFFCWLLGAGETWLIFHLMHTPVAIGPALVIDSLIGAIRMAAFFVPGAVGAQEGGYVLLCGLFGLSPATALAFSFARRGRDILIAAPVLLSWQWREARKVLPVAPP